MALERRLTPTWEWILTVMDATEAQLRFGASLTHSTDPSHPLHPLHLNSPPTQPAASSSLSGLNVLGGSSQSRTRLIDTSNPSNGNTTRIVGFSASPESQRNFDRDNYAQSSRREFLTYALSLMRSHSSEHRDSLPVLDITALRHVAYVIDGIVYYMRSGKENEDKSDSSYWADADENENDDTEDEIQMNCDNESIDDDVLSPTSNSRHTFFQRSESTLCLGCPPPDPFSSPINEALPLADQPHLLHPNANREDLFGIPKQPVTLQSSQNEPQGSFSPLEFPPTRLGISSAPRTANQFEANASFAETQNSDITVQEDQSMSTDNDEKATDKATNNDSGTASTSKTSESTSNQSLAGPSTSKETTSRQAPENYNIYMQLKKKTYFDFYENDKRTDTPQDLSCTKSNTEPTKMDIDNDTEMTDSESSQQDKQSLSSGESSSSAAVRPQIIVSPRKSSAFIMTSTKSENAKESSSNDSTNFGIAGNDSSNSSTAANSDQGNSLGSPSKSVIVRAGSSASTVFVFFQLFSEIIIFLHKFEFGLLIPY